MADSPAAVVAVERCSPAPSPIPAIPRSCAMPEMLRLGLLVALARVGVLAAASATADQSATQAILQRCDRAPARFVGGVAQLAIAPVVGSQGTLCQEESQSRERAGHGQSADCQQALLPGIGAFGSVRTPANMYTTRCNDQRPNGVDRKCLGWPAQKAKPRQPTHRGFFVWACGGAGNRPDAISAPCRRGRFPKNIVRRLWAALAAFRWAPSIDRCVRRASPPERGRSGTIDIETSNARTASDSASQGHVWLQLTPTSRSRAAPFRFS
jgi:hypothetical protein